MNTVHEAKPENSSAFVMALEAFRSQCALLPTPIEPSPGEIQSAFAQDYAPSAKPVRRRKRRDREQFVRFGSEGQRVQYRDAADASEHRLRMMEGLC